MIFSCFMGGSEGVKIYVLIRGCKRGLCADVQIVVTAETHLFTLKRTCTQTAADAEDHQSSSSFSATRNSFYYFRASSSMIVVLGIMISELKHILRDV